LGASASAQGRLGDRFNYSVGFRHHNNSYLFKSMDTEGSYSTSYTDLQGVFGYHLNPHLDLSLLAIWTRNRYGLIPSSRTTTFGGSATQSLEFNVYFDGREVDSYNTLLGALTLDYHPSDDFQLRWITSAQLNREQELYDIQDQYWLYEVGVGSNAADTNRFDRGVGTFLEHARNYLTASVLSMGIGGQHKKGQHDILWGTEYKLENISDNINEWEMRDSAGYSLPHTGKELELIYNLR
jgi:hypothetical protein